MMRGPPARRIFFLFYCGVLFFRRPYCLITVDSDMLSVMEKLGMTASEKQRNFFLKA
jgi:hypothetical protein